MSIATKIIFTPIQVGEGISYAPSAKQLLSLSELPDSVQFQLDNKVVNAEVRDIPASRENGSNIVHPRAVLVRAAIEEPGKTRTEVVHVALTPDGRYIEHNRRTETEVTIQTEQGGKYIEDRLVHDWIIQETPNGTLIARPRPQNPNLLY